MKVFCLILLIGSFAKSLSKVGEVCFPFGTVKENNSEAGIQGRPGKIGPPGVRGPQGLIGPPGSCNCTAELSQTQGVLKSF